MTARALPYSPDRVKPQRTLPSTDKIPLRLPSFGSFTEYDEDDLKKKYGNSSTTHSKTLWRVALVLMAVVFLVTRSLYHHTTLLLNDTFAPDEQFLTADDYAAYFGTPRPLGAECVTAADCVGGTFCAFPTVHNHSARICCADAIPLGASSIFKNDGESALFTHVCTGQAAVGQACAAHNELCASGYCVRGRCAARPLHAGERCDQDTSCASQNCGYGGGDAAQDLQCCADGHAHTVQPPGLPYKLKYCAHLPLGARCGVMDEVCASGACRQGVCSRVVPT